ncbi:MAG: GNAT family N-acetyltransferase [Erysipelotrichaceae bacterium]|nr:GNAT family N-acetyltransferase [Erysipelotrichaceae bacterium]
MKLRKSRDADIPQIMAIIDEAKSYLKSQNINQWQDGYPNSDVIKNDIILDRSFVLEDDGRIVATAMLEVAIDPTYISIDGAWLNNEEYLVVHRIAVDDSLKGRGIAKIFLDEAIKYFNPSDIKMDTHKDNISMQHFLKKYGFKYCGVIYLNNNEPRLAYQLSR